MGGSHGVEGIAVTARPPHVDDGLYDEIRTVPESEARTTTRVMARETGVFGGVSTGMNVAATVDRASELSPDAAVVTVACGTGLKYLAGDLYR
jgi:cysteine synthase